MRFSYLAIAVAAIAGSASASPIHQSRDLSADIANALSGINASLDELDLGSIEAVIKSVLGEAAELLDNAIEGTETLASNLQKLLDSGVPEGAVVNVLEAVDKIKAGESVESVNAWLKEKTNGVISDIEETLDIDNIVEALKGN